MLYTAPFELMLDADNMSRLKTKLYKVDTDEGIITDFTTKEFHQQLFEVTESIGYVFKGERYVSKEPSVKLEK